MQVQFLMVVPPSRRERRCWPATHLVFPPGRAAAPEGHSGQGDFHRLGLSMMRPRKSWGSCPQVPPGPWQLFTHLLLCIFLSFLPLTSSLGPLQRPRPSRFLRKFPSALFLTVTTPGLSLPPFSPIQMFQHEMSFLLGPAECKFGNVG